MSHTVCDLCFGSERYKPIGGYGMSPCPRCCKDAAPSVMVQRHLYPQEVQEKLIVLEQMRPCPAGFEWRPEGTGYRCAGESHFISQCEANQYIELTLSPGSVVPDRFPRVADRAAFELSLTRAARSAGKIR